MTVVITPPPYHTLVGRLRGQTEWSSHRTGIKLAEGALTEPVSVDQDVGVERDHPSGS